MSEHNRSSWNEAPRSFWPDKWLHLGAGAAGMITVLGIGSVISSRGSHRTADAPVGHVVLASSIEPVAPVVTVEQPSQPTETAPSHRVSLTIDPADAHVFRAGRDLGRSPLTIEVASRENVTLGVQREGFRSQVVVVDGSAPEVTIKLAKTERTQALPADSSGIPRTSRQGGVVVVNPWAGQ